MSNLSEKHELFARLHREDSAAIAALIDLKTEDDMDKVLNKLDTMQSSINARFEGFDARLDAMQSGFDARLSTLYWAIGFAVTVLALLRFFN